MCKQGWFTDLEKKQDGNFSINKCLSEKLNITFQKKIYKPINIAGDKKKILFA